MISEELCLVNLSNMEYKYINVLSVDDFYNKLNEFNKFNNDIEVQYMNGVLSGASTNKFIDILKISEEYKIDLEEVGAIYNYFNNIEDTKNTIENSYTIINASNKENAFIEYLDSLDFFNGIPSNIVNYLDYESIMRDYEIEVLNIINYKDNYIFC